MTLKELRVLYPTIKAVSKVDFENKVRKLNKVVDTNPRLKILQLHFKDYFYTKIDQDIYKAFEIFMDQEDFAQAWNRNSDMNKMMVKYYNELFRESTKITACQSCINNKLYRIRKHLRRYVIRG